jgi:hypothetical protein
MDVPVEIQVLDQPFDDPGWQKLKDPRRIKLFTEHPEKRCKAHSKRTGFWCTNVVTPGYRVCRLHGANPTNHGGRPPKTGKGSVAIVNPTDHYLHLQDKYSRALEGHSHLLDLYEQYRADPELLSVQDEIALMRGRLAQRLGQLPEGDNVALEMEFDRHLAGLTEQIAKHIERQHKMQFDQRNVLTVHAMLAFAAQFASICNEEISNTAERVRVRDRLAALVGAMQQS